MQLEFSKLKEILKDNAKVIHKRKTKTKIDNNRKSRQTLEDLGAEFDMLSNIYIYISLERV